jgi:hypothetical protein
MSFIDENGYAIFIPLKTGPEIDNKEQIIEYLKTKFVQFESLPIDTSFTPFMLIFYIQKRYFEKKYIKYKSKNQSQKLNNKKY